MTIAHETMIEALTGSGHKVKETRRGETVAGVKCKKCAGYGRYLTPYGDRPCWGCGGSGFDWISVDKAYGKLAARLEREEDDEAKLCYQQHEFGKRLDSGKPLGWFDVTVKGEVVSCHSKLSDAEAIEKARSLSSDFASELLSQLDAKGHLSDKQACWIHKLVNDDAERRHQAGPDAGPVGDVGEELSVMVTVEEVKEVETSFGTSRLHRMRDDAGHLFIWWCSGKGALEVSGEPVAVIGRVKKHDEFRGETQTVLTRVRTGG